MKNKRILKNWRLLQNCGGKPGLSVDTGNEVIPITGDGAQPDLSQNDPDAADFVKGRTHYAIDEYGFVAKEQTVQITDEGYADLAITSAQLIQGETYIVTLNGIRYECVPWWNDDWEAVILGNGSFVEKEGRGEDVPFAIDLYLEDDTAYLTAEEGKYTVSVEGAMSGIKTIPPMFLPPDIGGGSGGETYDLDVLGVPNASGGSIERWDVLSGSFDEIKTKLKNAEVVKCRIRYSFMNNSVEFFVDYMFYDAEDEEIDISALSSEGVTPCCLSSDNSFTKGNTKAFVFKTT